MRDLNLNLDLLVSNSSLIFAQLRWAGFRRLQLTTHVADTLQEARDHLERVTPAAVILEYDPSKLDAFELCKTIRRQLNLASLPVFIICKMSISQALLVKIMDSGCTEVLTAPLAQGEIHGLLCKYLSISRRRLTRVSVQAEVVIEHDPPLNGSIHDLTPYGARLQLSERFKTSPGHKLRLSFGTGLRVETSVVWFKHKKGFTELAVQFEAASDRVVVHLENLTTWRLEDEDDRQIVVLLQSLTERSNFSELGAQLEMPVVFDLRRLTVINSLGVSRWIELLRKLDGVVEYQLAHCSVTFCIQASYIADMTGQGEVLSLFVPYECPSCNRELQRELQVSEIDLDREPVVPACKCPSCKSEMVFADVPGRYFEFLKR